MKLVALFTLAASAMYAGSFAGSEALDAAVEEAIQKGRIPGAVLVVGALVVNNLVNRRLAAQAERLLATPLR